MRASLPHGYLYDLHQNDTVTGIGCLAAGQTTDHWAQATGLQPGCDMTPGNFSYNSPGALAQIEARIGKKCYKADFFTIAQ